MMAAFPFVGAVIAFFEAAWFVFALYVMNVLQKSVSVHFFALGFTLIPVFVTGGIHLDGFMDTCDALASHAGTEKKLEILKDSHSGAFAVLGCVLYFLSWYVLSLELFGSNFTLVLPFFSIFLISRFLSAFAAATFPIAKNSGLIHTFSTALARRFTAIWCAFWFILISLALIYFWNYLGIALSASCLSIFCFYFVTAVKNFGGITGDTEGAFVQICELISLAICVISFKLL